MVFVCVCVCVWEGRGGGGLASSKGDRQRVLGDADSAAGVRGGPLAQAGAFHAQRLMTHEPPPAVGGKACKGRFPPLFPGFDGFESPTRPSCVRVEASGRDQGELTTGIQPQNPTALAASVIMPEGPQPGLQAAAGRPRARTRVWGRTRRIGSTREPRNGQGSERRQRGRRRAVYQHQPHSLFHPSARKGWGQGGGRGILHALQAQPLGLGNRPASKGVPLRAAAGLAARRERCGDGVGCQLARANCQQRARHMPDLQAQPAGQGQCRRRTGKRCMRLAHAAWEALWQWEMIRLDVQGVPPAHLLVKEAAALNLQPAGWTADPRA